MGNFGNQGGGPPYPPQGGYPQQQQGGYPPQQQQGGYPQQQGYPPQQPPPGYQPGYQQPGYSPQRDPILQGLSGGMPTNAWIPAAILSLFIPGAGLFLLPRQDLKAMGIKILLGYFACMWVIPIMARIMASVTGIYIFGWFGYPFHLLGLLFHVGSMIYTHDSTVKMVPSLGQPIFFKQ